MIRTNRWLLLLVAAEIIVGGVVVGRRLARPAPPEPDWGLLEPGAAAELRAAASGCESAEDWRRLGELYMAEGCFRESEMCHRVACKLAPNDATSARQWGFALERLALLDEANAQYRRMAELGREDADAGAYFVGRNLLRAGKPQKARAAFVLGQALDANRYELARLHLRAGELAEAESLLRGLEASQPNALQVHLLAYRVALERGDGPRAFAAADAARYAPEKLLNPFDHEAARIVKVTQVVGSRRLWKEARDVMEVGRLADAEKLLSQAGPGTPGIDELRAELALRRGRFAEAASLLEACEARAGQSARLAARLGDTWAAAGQHDKARANWLRATRLEAGADPKAVYHNLARSFADAGDKANADWYLARGHYFVGRDLLRFGYAQQSLDYFTAAGKHDPQFAQAWFYLGEARRRAGHPGAAEAYRACLKLNPDHGRALAGLAAVEPAGK